MFWISKRKKHLSISKDSDQTIHLCSGGFYHGEKPINPSYQMLCMYPHEIDGDISFAEFALRCAGLILSDYPFVLESVTGHDIYPLDCYPFLDAHRNAGGQLILSEKYRLLAKVNAPFFFELIPEYDRRFFECEFYAYRGELSDAQTQAIANDLRNSNFALRIFYHECHDYLLIETAEDTLSCIKCIQNLCSQEGRKIFH